MSIEKTLSEKAAKLDAIPGSFFEDAKTPAPSPDQQTPEVFADSEHGDSLLLGTKQHIQQAPVFNSDKGETGEKGPQTPTSSDPKAPQKSSVSLDKLFGGKHAVNLADSLIPTLVVMLAGFTGTTINAEDLKMDQEEKETLIPFVDDYFKSVNFQMTPLTALLAMVGVIYGGKVGKVVKNAKKKTQVDKVMEETKDAKEIDLVSLEAKLVSIYRSKRRKSTDETRKWMRENGILPLTMENYKARFAEVQR